ncbi:MAG TPA: M1 family aminopeptidase, partial [Streptosporangiaceae bacterium]|nr:M1 family aminopeptidase [Streptosporangiaceae bacterium]
MARAITEAEARTRAQLIAVESYAVSLDLTDGAESARSRTEIRFSCRVPGEATFADLDASAVHAIVLNGEPVDPGSVAAGRLPLRRLAASNTLTVDATVAVSAGAGLSAYADPADGNRYLVASCFPAAAGSIFCCFDQPDLRAPLSLVVTLPAGWTAIANGEPVQRPRDGAAGVWRFSAVPAMKPYEFAFCAGPYVTSPRAPALTAGQTSLAVHCRVSLGSSAGLDRIVRIVGAVLPYYEHLLGVACPYPKVDIVCAPGIGPVAMQLPAVMYVSERLLQRAADADDEFVPTVLAHEVAHLWFGCLVEGRWWDDLWLAETMATYLSYAAMAAVLGRPDAWAEFGFSRQASAYEADSLPSTQPVSSPVQSAADALTRPPAVTYVKGTSVVRQLEAWLGSDAIWAGLNDYLTRHAWSATALSDLIGCWSRASDRDLHSWAVQWLRRAGVNELRPELTVGSDGAIASLAIVQQPPRTDADGPLRTHLLTAGLYDADESGLRCTRRVAVTVAGERTPVPELTGMRAPAAVIINDGDQTFATIRFDPASWTALATAAMDVTDPLAESVCWTAAFDMVQFGELDAADFAALVARTVSAGRPAVGLEQLLDRAVTAADRYAAPARRSAVREHLAAAV